METFWKEYDAIAADNNIFMHIQNTRKGRWRLQIFGKDMARTAGDAELMHAESDTREKMFEAAAERMNNVKIQLENMKGWQKNVGY